MTLKNARTLYIGLTDNLKGLTWSNSKNNTQKEWTRKTQAFLQNKFKKYNVFAGKSKELMLIDFIAKDKRTGLIRFAAEFENTGILNKLNEIELEHLIDLKAESKLLVGYKRNTSSDISMSDFFKDVEKKFRNRYVLKNEELILIIGYLGEGDRGQSVSFIGCYIDRFKVHYFKTRKIPQKSIN